MQTEETVTIKLSTYTDMQEELKTLRREVQKKTIIREVPELKGNIILTILLVLLMFADAIVGIL